MSQKVTLFLSTEQLDLLYLLLIEKAEAMTRSAVRRGYLQQVPQMLAETVERAHLEVFPDSPGAYFTSPPIRRLLWGMPAGTRRPRARRNGGRRPDGPSKH